MKCDARLHITKVDISNKFFWFSWIYSLLCRRTTLNYAASCNASPIRTVAPCMTDKCHITLTHSHTNDFSPVIHSNDFDSHRSINWDFAHPSATLDNWNNEIESTFKWPISLKKTIQNESRSPLKESKSNFNCKSSVWLRLQCEWFICRESHSELNFCAFIRVTAQSTSARYGCISLISRRNGNGMRQQSKLQSKNYVSSWSRNTSYCNIRCLSSVFQFKSNRQSSTNRISKSSTFDCWRWTSMPNEQQIESNGTE